MNFGKAAGYSASGDQVNADLARQRGYMWLAAGLILDAVGLVVILATGLDRVERLDAELASGGGPITEAYAAAFGLPQEAVLTAISESLGASARAGDPEVVDGELMLRLMRQGHLSDEAAGQVLYGLYQERGRLGSGETPWHQVLADLSGVPVAELAPLIAEPIDASLARAAVPGVVISARAALAPDAAATLNNVLNHILDAHVDTVLARMNELASAATGQPTLQ